ncbi:MAG: hypothetical protein MI799_09945 [Desulfobacterales bacterium]|nr:hypothetical protein [Desulfobacterales bacterium]
MITTKNNFLNKQIPKLNNRYLLTFSKDDTCIEYFLCSRRTGRQISKALIVSHEVFSGSLYVSRFYPELYREINCKYLSAACFYLMVHHAAGVFRLLNQCRVNLETDKAVFFQFYSRLREFHFYIRYARPADKVYLTGTYQKNEIYDNLVHITAMGRPGLSVPRLAP